MAERTYILKKPPNAKVGVRLMDSKRKRNAVEIQEVNPTSQLSGIVKAGEILVSINGELCNQGHKAAAEALGAATGNVQVVVKPKPPSTFGRLLSRGSSRNVTEVTGPIETIEIGDPEAEAEAGEEQQAAEGADAVPELEMAQPTGGGPEAAEAPQPPTLPQDGTEQLAPGEYIVLLKQASNNASIGMRLVQKRFDELPTVADIDKDGPASNTEIQVGDVLLFVNGVDARAEHAELKRALGAQQDATLKLRRPNGPSLESSAEEPPSKISTSGGMVDSANAFGGMKPSRCCGFRGAEN